jgi:hypothetical protein
MNSIDIKSLLIGVLLTSTVLFGVAAKNKKPDDGQWEVLAKPYSTTKFHDGYVNLLGEPGLLIKQGFEPFSVVASNGNIDKTYIFYRRRH